MNRRSFLGLTIGGVAASAATRGWLFRVFSFPSEISLPQPVYQDLGVESDVTFTKLGPGAYYAIEWPVTSKNWKFGSYVNEVMKHVSEQHVRVPIFGSNGKFGSFE